MVALAVVGIDVFVDGILIGICFAEGGSAGPLLDVALTTELHGLGVALAPSLQSNKRSTRRVTTTVGAVTLLIMIGGLLGTSLLNHLSPGPLSAVLAFATVALLYLVTEELLSEAHETPDTPLLTSMFLAGFPAILLLSFTNRPRGCDNSSQCSGQGRRLLGRVSRGPPEGQEPRPLS